MAWVLLTGASMNPESPDAMTAVLSRPAVVRELHYQQTSNYQWPFLWGFAGPWGFRDFQYLYRQDQHIVNSNNVSCLLIAVIHKDFAAITFPHVMKHLLLTCISYQSNLRSRGATIYIYRYTYIWKYIYIYI